jgi:uncharacterized membrane protein YoaT (DUF817 family)
MAALSCCRDGHAMQNLLEVRPAHRLVERVHMWSDALGERATAHGTLTLGLYELIRFGFKMAWACLFAGLMLVLLLATRFLWPADAPIARYDALTIAAVLIQIVLIATGLESRAEARTIAVFHIVGTIMEIFKTAMGSWIYPEPALLRIGGVPLFTGFMYACVGSFMVRAWHLFDFRLIRHPPVEWLALLSAAIYINFFTHHFVWDVRMVLFAAAIWLFAPATIHYRVWRVHRRMPLLLAAGLAAIFIYAAENVGTFAGAWLYPSQRAAWQMVPAAKYGSWFLLMILSWTLVVALKGRPAVEATTADVKPRPARRSRWRALRGPRPGQESQAAPSSSPSS